MQFTDERPLDDGNEGDLNINEDHSPNACIELFNDARHLPDSNRLEEGSYTEQLGRVKQILNQTNFKPDPSPVQNIRTRFDIMTREGQTLGLEFQHGKHEDWPLSWKFCGIDDSDQFNVSYPFNLIDMLESGFSSLKRRTVIIIPGYMTLDYVDWMHELNKTWLEVADINLIMVTWKSANQGSYESATSNTPFIARQIIILLHYLRQLEGGGLQLMDDRFLDDLHLIGHSCGAHIAGFVGKDLAGRLGRISGLDPAGPRFDAFEMGYQLHMKDAKLVDIYHSNMGILDKLSAACSICLDKWMDRVSSWSMDWVCSFASNVAVEADPTKPGSWFGINFTLGHIDYIMNNGHKQPLCNDRAHICDHSLVTKFLRDSLLYESHLLPDTRSMWRPLAFRARSHGDFLRGSSFKDHPGCNWITRDPSQELINDPNLNLDECSIPVDFITSPSDFRTQLVRDHKLDFGSIGTKVFLDTADQIPIVGDHFVIKLKMQTQQGENDETAECSLDTFQVSVKLQFNGDGGEARTSTIKTHTQFAPFTSDHPGDQVWLIPFQYQSPDSSSQHLMEIDWEDMINRGQDNHKWPTYASIFPRNFSILIEQSQSQSNHNTKHEQQILRTDKSGADDNDNHKHTTIKPTTSVTEEPNIYACRRLNFEYVGLQPLWLAQRRLFAQYELKILESPEDNCDLDSYQQRQKETYNQSIVINKLADFESSKQGLSLEVGKQLSFELKRIWI